MTIMQKYEVYIYERYKDLKNSQKEYFDYYDLCKIFEYYTAIELQKEYQSVFWEYNDI